jgi:protein arginine N-methyltransferase 3
MPNEIDSVSGSEASDEGEWLDARPGDDEETVDVISLLDDRVFPSALQMIDDCKERYNLDFLGIRDRLGLDFHGTVKLINFSGYPKMEQIGISTDCGPCQFVIAFMKGSRYRRRLI